MTDKQETLKQLDTAITLLEWDRDHTMPAGSGATRAEVLDAVHAVRARVAAGEFVGRAVPADEKPYDTIEAFQREQSLIGAARSIIGWMKQTEPSGAPLVDGDTLAAMDGIGFELSSRQDLAGILEAAKQQKVPAITPKQHKNLELVEHRFICANALDKELVEKLSKTTSECQEVWMEARKTNDFAAYEPLQQRVLELTREKAKRLGEVLDLPPYEALMDEFAPGVKLSRVNEIFDDLQQWLPGVITEIQQKQTAAPEKLEGEFPEAEQHALGVKLATAIGYDLNKGRLDKSTHPFSGGCENDSRITTRYDEADPASSIMAVVHESGHSLYQQGLLANDTFQPVDNCMGMDVHESQSLFWEKQVARTPEFLRFMLPKVKEAFPDNQTQWSEALLYEMVNTVKPSLIRVEADEATYPLHVILRTGIEQKLINGEMEFKDVPAAWNKGMKDLLDVDVPSDAQGCMQDIHWPWGAFGYFPSYTLGSLGAAQLFEQVKKEIPDVEQQFERGDFAPTLQWLRTNVHEQGCQNTPDELYTRVTGKPLDAEAFKRHVAKKYLGRDFDKEPQNTSFAKRVEEGRQQPAGAVRG